MVKKVIGLLVLMGIVVSALTGCANGTERDETHNTVPIISAGDNENDTVGSTVEKGDDPNYVVSDSVNVTKPQESSTTNSEGNKPILTADSIIGSWCTPTTILKFKENAGEIEASIAYFNEGVTYEGKAKTDNKTYINVIVENHYVDGVLQENGAKEVNYKITSFEVNESANTVTLTLVNDGQELKLMPYVE